MADRAIKSFPASVTTTGTCAASLPHDGSNFWFCSGFEITYGGATAAGLVTATLAGVLGGTQSYVIPVPAGITTGASFQVQFPSGCALPSADPNTDVVLSVPPLGSGNVACAVVLHGYKGSRQLNQ